MRVNPLKRNTPGVHQIGVMPGVTISHLVDHDPGTVGQVNFSPTVGQAQCTPFHLWGERSKLFTQMKKPGNSAFGELHTRRLRVEESITLSRNPPGLCSARFHFYYRTLLVGSVMQKQAFQ